MGLAFTQFLSPTVQKSHSTPYPQFHLSFSPNFPKLFPSTFPIFHSSFLIPPNPLSHIASSLISIFPIPHFTPPYPSNFHLISASTFYPYSSSSLTTFNITVVIICHFSNFSLCDTFSYIIFLTFLSLLTHITSNTPYSHIFPSFSSHPISTPQTLSSHSNLNHIYSYISSTPNKSYPHVTNKLSTGNLKNNKKEHKPTFAYAPLTIPVSLFNFNFYLPF